MKWRIFTIKFWKTVFGTKEASPKVVKDLPKPKSMPEKLIQPEKPKPLKISASKSEIQRDLSRLIVRSELNLEQNSIFAVSTFRGKSRDIIVRDTASTGEITERRAIIGRTIDGVETGVLTTNHFKLYLALLDLWEKANRPLQEPVHFTILKITKQLKLVDSGANYEVIRRHLTNLRQIPLTFINSFYFSKEETIGSLEPFSVLNHLKIYERKNVGQSKKTRGYGEFMFDKNILLSLINNHTHPLRLDIITSFKKHKDLAILLYTYLDRNLAFKSKYEIGLEKLYDHLDLSQRQIRYPSDRKAKLEPVIKELLNKRLSTGTLSYCRIQKTRNNRDYKLVCHKKPVSQRIGEGETPFQLVLPTELPKPKEQESDLLTVLNQKGLTQRQAENLLSQKGEEVIKAQLSYLPFRLEEYKGQGKPRNPAAMLYDSIKDNWQPPLSYVNTEKEKRKDEERKAKKAALQEEYKERVQAAQAEAQGWANRPPEDRVAEPLKSWIWSQNQFEHHQPTDDEIKAKKEELISHLQTKEEHEQWLISKIEAELRTEIGKL